MVNPGLPQRPPEAPTHSGAALRCWLTAQGARRAGNTGLERGPFPLKGRTTGLLWAGKGGERQGGEGGVTQGATSYSLMWGEDRRQQTEGFFQASLLTPNPKTPGLGLANAPPRSWCWDPGPPADQPESQPKSRCHPWGTKSNVCSRAQWGDVHSNPLPAF